jgi:hypothetical protein
MRFTPAQQRPDIAVMPLFQNRWEKGRLEHWVQYAMIELVLPGGIELLVLERLHRGC